MTGMGRHDRVAYFVSRWFAYLDVIGSLSGNKNGTPLASFYWSNDNISTDEDFEIDCLMGFTNQCIGSLARISELAKRCEPQRIDERGNVREGWVPCPEIVEEAVRIRRALEEGLLDRNIRKGCNHRSSTSSESEGAWDATEIYATNELFHWAGLIHLYRRILGKPAMDAEVQHAVREIVGLLYKIRKGSTAEACLIFPMFAAGCDAQDEGQREKILNRLEGVEEFGLNHVSMKNIHVDNISADIDVGAEDKQSHEERLGYWEAMGVACVGRVLWLNRGLLTAISNVTTIKQSSRIDKVKQSSRINNVKQRAEYTVALGIKA